MEITHLKHHQINKKKWDSAIKKSKNGLVYALSWFLDIVSPNWEALVLGDYEYIMPLTWRSKFGFRYVYQPIFIQQLGIFSKLEVKQEIVDQFIDKLSNRFKYIDLQLNYANPKVENENFILRNTQLIDLNKSYRELFKNYKRNHKNNLKKIAKTDFVINDSGAIEDFIKLTEEMYVRKGVSEIRTPDIQHLKKVVQHSLKLGIGEFSFGRLNHEICAAAFFLTWKERVVVYTALSELGREIGAMFGIIDKFLKDNAGKNLLFDFAGSNIPGVKYRNLGFGARNEIYYRVTINNLPIPLKWFKK